MLRFGISVLNHRISHLVIGDVDGLHDLEKARRVLRRPVPSLARLHDDGGEGEVLLSLETLHERHQLRLVPGTEVRGKKRSRDERGGGGKRDPESKSLRRERAKTFNSVLLRWRSGGTAEHCAHWGHREKHKEILVHNQWRGGATVQYSARRD